LAGGCPHEHERIAYRLPNFVKAKVSAGRYSPSNEVVREALRLMENNDLQDAERLRLLRKAWQKASTAATLTR
jgi:putative addiction module CopG family antidote